MYVYRDVTTTLNYIAVSAGSAHARAFLDSSGECSQTFSSS